MPINIEGFLLMYSYNYAKMGRRPENMTPEEFRKNKRLEQKILDSEDGCEDNSGGLPNEDDPQDWCPEHW
jgi:hypothetical protein